MMTRETRIIFIHLLTWILFLTLPVFILRTSDLLTSEESGVFIFDHAFRTLLLASVFYLNLRWLLPFFFFGNKQKYFYLFNIAAIAVVLVTSKFIGQHLAHQPADPNIRPAFLLSYLLMMVLAIGIAFVIFLYNRFKLAEERKAEIELAYVKSRLNPHFLFNTLNSIYALAVRRSELTADAVSRLSSIMRYVITESGSDKVLLSKEMDYISDFIELQKLRMTGKTKVTFRFEGITADKKIVPLLLISFVENAFKFGVSTEHDSEIDILIDIRGDELSLHVQNTKIHGQNIHDEVGGLGLETARQLLEHFYQRRYSLTLMDNTGNFVVDLKINLV